MRLKNGWVVLLLVAASIALLLQLDRGLRSVYPHGEGVEGMPTIVELQLSFSEDRFRHVLELWSGELCTSDRTASAECYLPEGTETHPFGIKEFKRSTILYDYAFPIIYALAFLGALGWLWKLGDREFALMAQAMAVMAFADWAENSLHLLVLRGIDSYDQLAGADLWGPGIWFASAFATIKWLLLVIALLGAVAGLVAQPWVRRRSGLS